MADSLPPGLGAAGLPRQREPWWGRSQPGSRLPSCPVRLRSAAPELRVSSRGEHAISSPLPAALRMSAQLRVFSSSLPLPAVSEHAAARLHLHPCRAVAGQRQPDGVLGRGRGAAPPPSPAWTAQLRAEPRGELLPSLNITGPRGWNSNTQVME